MTSIQSPYSYHYYSTPKTDTTTIIIPNANSKPLPRTSPPTNLTLTRSRSRSRSYMDNRVTPRKKYLTFGPYILGSTLGEGEFGKMKLGWTKNNTSSSTDHHYVGSISSPLSTEISKQVAIKLIKKQAYANDPKKEAKIFREINALKQLHHPNIVKLEEVLQNSRYIGIVLEYASCGEFYKYIQRKHRLKEHVACRLFAQLISGVTYIHSKGLVHRDLKLENLLLDKHENLIITDFGFVNEFQLPDALMKTSCGSPCYAAPELVSGSEPYEARKADIWSCGVILFAMLAGYLPWDDDPENPEGDNIGRLYYYITYTPLKFPEYITPIPRDLLRRILVADPNVRADETDIIKHPWLAPHSPFLSISSSEWDKIAMSRNVLKLPKHVNKHNSLNISAFSCNNDNNNNNINNMNSYYYDHAVHSNSSSINSINTTINNKSGISLNHYVYSTHSRSGSGVGNNGTRPISFCPINSGSNSLMDKCDSLVIDSTLNLSPAPPRESQSHVISIPSTPNRDYLVTSPLRGHSRNNSAASLALQAVVNADRESKMFNLQVDTNSGYRNNEHRVSSQHSRRSYSNTSASYTQSRTQRSSDQCSRKSNGSDRDLSPLQQYSELRNIPKLTLNTTRLESSDFFESGQSDRSSSTKSPSSIVRHDFIGVSTESSLSSTSSSLCDQQSPPVFRARQPLSYRKPRPTSYHPSLFSTSAGNISSGTSLSTQKCAYQFPYTHHQYLLSQHAPTSRPERHSALYSLSETSGLFDSSPVLSSSNDSSNNDNNNNQTIAKPQSMKDTKFDNPVQKQPQQDEHCLRVIDTSVCKNLLNKQEQNVLPLRKTQTWSQRHYSYTGQQYQNRTHNHEHEHEQQCLVSHTPFYLNVYYYGEDNKENVDITGNCSTSMEKPTEIPHDGTDDTENGENTLTALTEPDSDRCVVDKGQNGDDDDGKQQQGYQPSRARRVLNFFKTRSIKL